MYVVLFNEDEACEIIWRSSGYFENTIKKEFAYLSTKMSDFSRESMGINYPFVVIVFEY